MDRSTRAGIFLVASLASAATCGCLAEDEEKDRPLQVTGTITYDGGPVKKGAIHFLPVDPRDPSASGVIEGGRIENVFTRTPGDGIKPGKYRVAINSFDEAFLASVAQRDYNGPDPVEVGKAADQLKLKKLIPPRYSNVRESGLTAEVFPGRSELHFSLVD